MGESREIGLNNLSPNPGAKRRKKVLGRGPASGFGGTSGKGHKGQNSRSGGKRGSGFEGGQMPIQRRVPKRGFTNIFKKTYKVINVEDLQKFDEEITPEVLIEKGMNKKGLNVKILGRGNIDKAVTVHAAFFSRTAKAKIEKSGGKALLVK
ncbi:MAG: 50S ribosomal protein L15 [Nitrospinota bacterium]